MNEQALVKDAISEIFRKSGYGNITQMTQRDFDYVADEIEKKSGIVISGTTIKRLALGDFSRLPQVATLNAIANYFDYKTWQDFKTSKFQAGAARKVEATPLNSKDTPDLKSKRKKFSFAVGILILLAIPVFYFFKP